jgi:thiamine biosynthesis lipoprotein
MPAREDVLAAQQAVGLDKVVFDNDAKSVQFTQPGSCLDVGGMVKGYALDVVVQRLRICGIHTGMVDLGGNVFCLEGPPPGRKAYSIGVRHPFDRGRLLGTCHLLNCAVSTSGSYEQFVEFSGKRFTHIVDPRTGYPVPDVASVSVVTPRGVDSDVYSTAVFVAGEALVTRFRRTHARTAVLVVNLDPTGQALVRRYGWVWPGFPP